MDNAEQREGMKVGTYGRYCGSGSGLEGPGLPVSTEEPLNSRGKRASAVGSSSGSAISGGADGRGCVSASGGALGKKESPASKGGADGWGSGSTLKSSWS